MGQTKKEKRKIKGKIKEQQKRRKNKKHKQEEKNRRKKTKKIEKEKEKKKEKKKAISAQAGYFNLRGTRRQRQLVVGDGRMDGWTHGSVRSKKQCILDIS